MRILFRSCAATFLIAALALPTVAGADGPENYAKDASQAESTPPMIPHQFMDTAGGGYCLGCHGSGVKGAPMTPHPERLSCTGCHGQGVIRETKPVKKSKHAK